MADAEEQVDLASKQGGQVRVPVAPVVYSQSCQRNLCMGQNKLWAMACAKALLHRVTG